MAINIFLCSNTCFCCECIASRSTATVAMFFYLLRRFALQHPVETLVSAFCQITNASNYKQYCINHIHQRKVIPQHIMSYYNNPHNHNGPNNGLRQRTKSKEELGIKLAELEENLRKIEYQFDYGQLQGPELSAVEQELHTLLQDLDTLRQEISARSQELSAANNVIKRWIEELQSSGCSQ